MKWAQKAVCVETRDSPVFKKVWCAPVQTITVFFFFTGIDMPFTEKEKPFRH